RTGWAGCCPAAGQARRRLCDGGHRGGVAGPGILSRSGASGRPTGGRRVPRSGGRESTTMNRARVLALLAAFALAPAASRGAPRSRDVFEARVEAELQTQSPDAVAAWTQGNAARDAGDHRKAAALFEQVAALAPGFSHAKRRLAGE